MVCYQWSPWKLAILFLFTCYLWEYIYKKSFQILCPIYYCLNNYYANNRILLSIFVH